MIPAPRRGVQPIDLVRSTPGIHRDDHADITDDRPRPGAIWAYLGLLARLEVAPAMRDRVDLSGVVQQTLLEAHQGLVKQPDRLRSDEEVAAWLRSILGHNLSDAIRKLAAQKRDVRREWSLDAALDQSASRLERWLAAEHSSPSQRAVRAEELLEMAEALTTLPDAQRRAIELHHLRGMALSEIARELDTTRAAVAGLLHRGMKALRARLGES